MMPKSKSKKTIEKPEDKEKALELALISLEKEFGKGVIIQGETSSFPEIGRIPSGAASLDQALSGGYARGRVIEVSGPECIAHGSYIPYEVWNGATRSNHKGGTIQRLYERFHHIKLRGGSNQNKNTEFYVKSVDHEGKIIKNKVLNVLKTGKKQCLKLELETGEVIFATKDHKFMTPSGFKPLSDLSFGDTVFVHNNTRQKGQREHTTRPTICVKYHPLLPIKNVKCNKTGYTYKYYRGQRARLAYEAYLNNLSYKEYIRYLNQKTIAEIEELTFIPPDMHIHHIDENYLNDNIDNLKLINPKEHGQLHAKNKLKNLSFVAVESKIINISNAGEYETYDLTCGYPYNNYIAEGFVVHNSAGKTSLALHAIAECQKLGGKCAFLDVEHALDVYYAEALGVDIANTIISQPDCAEDTLNIVDRLTRSNAIDLIVVDSVAALVSRKELEGEIGDSSVGLQARLMSQAMRMLVGPVQKTNTTIMFLNQIRMKIGVMYGSPEVVSGGNALKFYASQRLDIRRIETLKDGDDKTGIRTRIKVVKNKVGPPFRQTELNIMFGEGIDWAADLLDMGLEAGLIEKSGAWFSHHGEQIGQGSVKAASTIRENENIRNKLKEELFGPTSVTVPATIELENGELNETD